MRYLMNLVKVRNDHFHKFDLFNECNLILKVIAVSSVSDYNYLKMFRNCDKII